MASSYFHPADRLSQIARGRGGAQAPPITDPNFSLTGQQGYTRGNQTAPGPSWWLNQTTGSQQTQSQPSGRVPFGGRPMGGRGGFGYAGGAGTPIAGVGAGSPPAPGYTYPGVGTPEWQYNPLSGNYGWTDESGNSYIYNWITGLPQRLPPAA